LHHAVAALFWHPHCFGGSQRGLQLRDRDRGVHRQFRESGILLQIPHRRGKLIIIGIDVHGEVSGRFRGALLSGSCGIAARPGLTRICQSDFVTLEQGLQIFQSLPAVRDQQFDDGDLFARLI
jgi:hypothetical protein